MLQSNVTMNLLTTFTRRKKIMLSLVILKCIVVAVVSVAYLQTDEPIASKGQREANKESEKQTEILIKVLKNLSRGLNATKPLKAVETSGIKMAAEKSDKQFNADQVLKLFTACREADDILSVDCYANAYEELCKLFRLFGTVFSFVSSDVEEKIGILREFRTSENAESYRTIQGMLSYEVANDLTNTKKKPSASRTLLRLHRALEFIAALLKKIRDTPNSEKFSTEATEAYDNTLAAHHPWLVKKGVHVAMYMLPGRAELLKKMNIEDSDAGKEGMTKLIDEIQIIYDITQALYVKDDLLKLP